MGERNWAASWRDRTADEREQAAGIRDRLADQRDRIAEERERIADQREQLADQREQLADEREWSADQRETELHGLGTARGLETGESWQPDDEAIVRSSAESARSSAQTDRGQASFDREEAARCRERLRVQRSQADTDRLHRHVLLQAYSAVHLAKVLRRTYRDLSPSADPPRPSPSP
jgi:hypothetical protein